MLKEYDVRSNRSGYWYETFKGLGKAVLGIGAFAAILYAGKEARESIETVLTFMNYDALESLRNGVVITTDVLLGALAGYSFIAAVNGVIRGSNRVILYADGIEHCIISGRSKKPIWNHVESVNIIPQNFIEKKLGIAKIRVRGGKVKVLGNGRTGYAPIKRTYYGIPHPEKVKRDLEELLPKIFEEVPA
ncbi:hypothetical protein ACFL2V_22010 [Pseudomonadota bacterium]